METKNRQLAMSLTGSTRGATCGYNKHSMPQAHPLPPTPLHKRSLSATATHSLHNVMALCPNGEAGKEAADFQSYSQHISNLHTTTPKFTSARRRARASLHIFSDLITYHTVNISPNPSHYFSVSLLLHNQASMHTHTHTHTHTHKHLQGWLQSTLQWQQAGCPLFGQQTL